MAMFRQRLLARGVDYTTVSKSALSKVLDIASANAGIDKPASVRLSQASRPGDLQGRYVVTRPGEMLQIDAQSLDVKAWSPVSGWISVGGPTLGGRVVGVPTNTFAATLTTGVTLGLFAACSRPAGGPDTPRETEPTIDPELSTTWTDRNGFTYRLQVTSFDLDVDVDTERSAPGTAEVTYDYQVRAEVFNTTPDRVAPFPTSAGTIRPVWDAGSIACDGERDLFDWPSYDVATADAASRTRA
ncbi:hypothetical protein GC089_18090 [Cellulomonas sp. JZ18]|uniref:hypothetical protein n=1 Tax=Cellulomonas sp. JZ18 TaxID=2654191 RepID=UPI0012D3F15D|nr:hypothetical protein [Cellulomonas sp. JZ18]QGQ20751.1 hypothetical protein GC089_18090 [Cellulomonas sp. JZ18]